MRWLWLTFVAVVLAGCRTNNLGLQAQADEDTALRISRWGEIITIAHAAQAVAPQLTVSHDRLIAVWVGATDDEVLLFERIFSAQSMTDALSLPIPSAYPHQFQTLPVSSGGAHLLWMDAVYNQPEGDTLLWTARLNENAEMPRSHIRLSDIRVESYDVIADETGGAVVLWTGGARGEPALYVQTLDLVGRPDFPERLTTDARFPSLVRSDNMLSAYWLRASDQLALHGEVMNDALANITPAVDSPVLAPMDRIVDFYALSDAQTRYVFWQINRADAAVETWMAYSPLATENWSTPERLGIGDVSEEPYETTFNGGHALQVSTGEAWLGWSSPLKDQTVALVAEINDQLVVVYFTNGQVVAVQAVVDLTHSLIGQPAIFADRDRHLTLAWAEPTESGLAELNFTSTRNFELTEARNP